MARITIAQSNQAGEVPSWEMKKKKLLKDTLIEDILQLSDDRVFVCFQSWQDCKCDYEQPTFLITNNVEDALDFMEGFIHFIDDAEINFFFMGFENYEDAFKYCLDLKHGL